MSTLPDPLTVVQQRLVTQGVEGGRFRTATEAVRGLVAVQAQVWPEVVWSLGMRSGETAAEVEAAFDRGEFLRTHLLRPTWHVAAREDLRDLLRLTAPRVQQVNAYSYRQFGLDGATLARGVDLLQRLLADGPLTRSALTVHLGPAGLPTVGLPLGYLLMHAELEQLICSGPLRGRQHTYVLLDDLVPATPERPGEDVLDEVVLRYFVSRGPATVHDLATWSGLTITDVRAAVTRLGGRLPTYDAPDGQLWYGGPPSAAATGTAHLVPMYDEMTIAYRDLRVVVDGEVTHPLERPLLVGGRTVGTWRRTLGAKRVTVEIALYRALSDDERTAVRVEVDRFGDHLGRRAELRLVDPPPPGT